MKTRMEKRWQLQKTLTMTRAVMELTLQLIVSRSTCMPFSIGRRGCEMAHQQDQARRHYMNEENWVEHCRPTLP